MLFKTCRVAFSKYWWVSVLLKLIVGLENWADVAPVFVTGDWIERVRGWVRLKPSHAGIWSCMYVCAPLEGRLIYKVPPKWPPTYEKGHTHEGQRDPERRPQARLSY